jgi:hypothetical protein
MSDIEPNHPHGHVTVDHVAGILARMIAEEIRPDSTDSSSCYRAGKALTAFLFSVLPEGVEPDDWDARYAAFVATFRDSDGADVGLVLDWLDRELPGVMRIVPAAGRGEFAKGVIALMLPEAHVPRDPGPRRGRRRTRGKHHNST